MNSRGCMLKGNVLVQHIIRRKIDRGPLAALRLRTRMLASISLAHCAATQNVLTAPLASPSRKSTYAFVYLHEHNLAISAEQ